MRKLMYVLCLLWLCSCNQGSPEKGVLTESPAGMVHAEEVAKQASTGNSAMSPKKEEKVKLRAKVTPEQPGALKKFYQEVQKPKQRYTVNAQKDRTILCKEGTKISFKANSFLTEAGEPVVGEVEIKVQEFYKLSDIVLANLTTTSGGKMLETGGMIYIEASSKGRQCKLADDTYMEVAFPTANSKPDMQLFMGEWSNGEVNWVAANSGDQNQIFGYNAVDQKPVFPGGERRMYEFLGNNLTYPQAALTKGINGNVGVRFLVGKDGGIRDVRILKKLDPACDEEVLKALGKFPRFVPGKLKGQDVNVEMDLNVLFELPEWKPGKTWEIGQQQRTEIQTINNGPTKNIVNESAYLLQSSKLGWINCDRFINVGTNLTNCRVLHEKNQNLDVKIFFDEYRSLMRGSNKVSDIGTTFQNIPIGYNITVLAIKLEDDKIFMSKEDTVVTKNGEYELEFSEVTREQLKEELEKLESRE